MIEDDSKRPKPLVAPLQTALVSNPAPTPQPMIPTGIEAILSPRPTSTCGRNRMAIDELYNERRTLRREWIRFMESMNSPDAENQRNCSALDDKYQPMSPENKSEILDVELCYPTATNTNTCHLDSHDDENGAENRDECDEQQNDDEVFQTFRSLQEQVNRVDAILEEFSDLPNSPTTNPKIFKMLGDHLQGGPYNDCKTFEDEWDALDKLETELREELKSINVEMETKSYCEVEEQSKLPCNQTKEYNEYDKMGRNGAKETMHTLSERTSRDNQTSTSERTAQLQSLHKGEIRETKDSDIKPDVSYATLVPPVEANASENEKITRTKNTHESRGHTPASYAVLTVYSSASVSEINVPETEDSSENVENQIQEVESLYNYCESRDEESESESNLLVLPSKSASTLTRDDVPQTESMNSHDAKLNEILLEDETSHKDSMASEDGLLQHILLEKDDSDDSPFQQKTSLPIEATLFPATYPRSVSTNDPDENNLNHSKSQLSNECGKQFITPNLLFELDAMSGVSLDLMTTSVEETRDTSKTVTTRIEKKQTHSASITKLTNIEILNSESGEGIVSPLISPISTDGTINHAESSIDITVGGLYDPATVATVVVQGLGLDSLANTTESSLNQTIGSKSVADDACHVPILNGTETILTENQMKPAESSSSSSSSDISNDMSSELYYLPSKDVQILTGDNDIELIPLDKDTR